MKLLTVIFFCVCIVVDTTRCQTTFRGDQILKLSESTVDIFESFLGILSAQTLHNEAPTYFGVNIRNAPGEFVLDDSTKEVGGLTRIQLSFGSGTGDKLSDGAFFFGMTADNVTAVEKGNWTQQHSKIGPATSFQAILYAGYGAGDIQLAYGYIDKGSLSGLNEQNQFNRNPSSHKAVDLSSGHMITLYHSLGAFFSFSVSQARSYNQLMKEWKDPQTVTEMRFHLQPLKQLFAKEFGLPFLGVDRLSKLKDYYGQYADQVQHYYDTYGSTALSVLRKDPYEVTFGSDNMKWFSSLEELNIRAAVRSQVYPTFKFRKAELAGNWRFSEYVSAGVRAESYYGLAWNSSFDAYVMLGIYGSVQYGLSYSVNSPDETTFLPIRGASVLGLQVVYGFPEMIKPLIPIVQGLEDISEYEED